MSTYFIGLTTEQKILKTFPFKFKKQQPGDLKCYMKPTEIKHRNDLILLVGTNDFLMVRGTICGADDETTSDRPS